jgi:hypothetical protein
VGSSYCCPPHLGKRCDIHLQWATNRKLGNLDRGTGRLGDKVFTENLVHSIEVSVNVLEVNLSRVSFRHSSFWLIGEHWLCVPHPGGGTAYVDLDNLLQAGASSLEDKLGILAHPVGLVGHGARNDLGLRVAGNLAGKEDKAASLDALRLQDRISLDFNLSPTINS